MVVRTCVIGSGSLEFKKNIRIIYIRVLVDILQNIPMFNYVAVFITHYISPSVRSAHSTFDLALLTLKYRFTKEIFQIKHSLFQCKAHFFKKKHVRHKMISFFALHCLLTVCPRYMLNFKPDPRSCSRAVMYTSFRVILKLHLQSVLRIRFILDYRIRIQPYKDQPKII